MLRGSGGAADGPEAGSDAVRRGGVAAFAASDQALLSEQGRVTSEQTVADPVVVNALGKTYAATGVQALRGISFRVSQGEVFGLLGPNGAGKTTTVGILTTLVRPTSGTATVDGHDVTQHPLAVRRSIGVVFQDTVLDNDFSGAHNLLLHARLWGVPDGRARIRSLLDAVGLADRSDDGVRTYSGGMRRRLEIARALLARPRVLFLDEPTLGLDPQIGRSIMNYVSDVQLGVSAINYNAAPLDARNKGDSSQVFNSAVNGEPSTTIFRAYPGDPVRFRAAMPFGTNVHNFTIDGHSWPWEPLMPGSQVLSNRTVMSGEFIDARLSGGAGGTLHAPGDYLYGDARVPYTRAVLVFVPSGG
jgi:ABC-type Na+ transport system ATPase subunit NatA